MKQKRIFRVLLTSLLLFLAVSILRHPLATNDGPVHLAFAHLISTYQNPSQPLQTQAYVVHLRPNPNLGVYVVMAYLLKVLSPALTESIIQLLCILGPVAAGYFAIRMINSRNTWLSLFLLPLTLNQMFFLGLYNHSISIAAFLLAIGTYIWLCMAPSYSRAVMLAGSLVLTFLCHASGFLMAFTGIASMIATATILSYNRERRLFPVLLAQRFAVLALVLPLPLGALFLFSGEKTVTKYGFTLPYRIKQFLELHLLTSNFPYQERYVAGIFGALLLISFVFVSTRIVTRRRELPTARRDLALSVIVAAIGAIAVMCAFPDIMGGGWTHFRRFEIFPYYWMILLLAFEEFTSTAANAFLAVGASVAILLIASLSIRQRMIRQQMAPLTEVDSLVGSHCTVLPIVFQSYLLDRNGNPGLDGLRAPSTNPPVGWNFTTIVSSSLTISLVSRPIPYTFALASNRRPTSSAGNPNISQTTSSRLISADSKPTPACASTTFCSGASSTEGRPRCERRVQSATRDFVSIYKSPDSRVELLRRQGVRNAACEMKQETHSGNSSVEAHMGY